MTRSDTVSKTPPASSTNSSSIPVLHYGSLDDSVIPSSSSRVHHRCAEHHHQLDNTGGSEEAGLHYHNPNRASAAIDGLDTTSLVSSQGGGWGGGPFSGEDEIVCCHVRLPFSMRRLALSLSLYLNVAITVAKLVAYLQTYSLSVLAALLDSVLDVVSQFVLNYTEQHSSMQRSSAFYPAGASRLEPIGVLTCAALMGMASFEVLKESITVLLVPSSHDLKPKLSTMYGMILIVGIKLALLWLCRRGALRRPTSLTRNTNNKNGKDTGIQMDNSTFRSKETSLLDDEEDDYDIDDNERAVADRDEQFTLLPNNNSNKVVVLDDHFSSATTKLLLQVQQQPPPVEYRIADPTLEALSLDHWNDCLSNGVAAIALLCSVRANATLWFLDPVGAIVISLYIIYSWYTTGKEQIEHLTGKSAPEEFIEELVDLANGFDERIIVDTVRAYHFGPKFLVEIEIVMDASTLLFESHDVGMELQYEIEGREEVERCFVHIDYQTRPYDEHVVSKVPELRDKYTKQPSNHKLVRSSQSL